MDSRATHPTEMTKNHSDGFQALEPEVIFAISDRLKLTDVYSWLSTNKRGYEFYQSDIFWHRKFGAEDILDFVCRLIVLDNDLQVSIMAANIKITEGEVTQQILCGTLEERIAYFIPPDIQEKFSKYHLIHCLSDGVVIALREGLITSTWAKAICDTRYRRLVEVEGGLNYLRDKALKKWLWNSKSDFFESFTRKRCLFAFREKIFTVEQMKKLNSRGRAGSLLGEHGLLALREGLITVEQVEHFPDDNRLSELLSDAGIYGLRKKKITPEWVAMQPLLNFRFVLEAIQFKRLKKLVENRLGAEFYIQSFDCRDISLGVACSIYTSLEPDHPTVNKACQKLEDAKFSAYAYRIDCITTEISVHKLSVNEFVWALEKMPKLENPLTPSSVRTYPELAEIANLPEYDTPKWLQLFLFTNPRRLLPATEAEVEGKKISVLFQTMTGIDSLSFTATLRKLYFKMLTTPTEFEVNVCAALLSKAQVSHAFEPDKLTIGIRILDETPQTLLAKLTALREEVSVDNVPLNRLNYVAHS